MYIFKDIFIYTIKEQCWDNENIHENDETTVKTLYLIISANLNGSIMRIRLWHNEHQRSVNHFSSCQSGP